MMKNPFDVVCVLWIWMVMTMSIMNGLRGG